MKYLDLRTYDTLSEKFKKAKAIEQLKVKRGVHKMPSVNIKDINGCITEETVFFHKWSSEYSCYVTEHYKLIYVEREGQ